MAETTDTPTPRKTHAFVSCLQLTPDDEGTITCRCGWSGPIGEWGKHLSTPKIPEMVERVARKLCESEHINPDGITRFPEEVVGNSREPPSSVDKKNWQWRAQQARAVIAAMHEPT